MGAQLMDTLPGEHLQRRLTSLGQSAAAVHSGVAEPSQVLVVEDDEALRRLLELTLKRDGYRVLTASNGQEALERFADHPVDLVLLDINMPVLNGYAVCMELRKQSHVPIIFVTVKSRTDDLVAGIGLGADNYITKPFVIQELRARIRALVQRVQRHTLASSARILTVGSIALDEDHQEVFVRGKAVSLTPTEFRLLRYLMHHPNQLLTKEEVLAALWEDGQVADTSFVRVTVHRLRTKLEADPSKPDYLKTAPRVGYQFCSESPSSNPQSPERLKHGQKHKQDSRIGT